MPQPVLAPCRHHWLVASLPHRQARDRTPSHDEMAYPAHCRTCGADRTFPLLDGWLDFNDTLPVPEPDRDGPPAEPLLREPSPEELAAWAEALHACLRAG